MRHSRNILAHRLFVKHNRSPSAFVGNKPFVAYIGIEQECGKVPLSQTDFCIVEYGVRDERDLMLTLGALPLERPLK